jgi:cardiolipin synthase (CMP-forming)
VARPPVGDEPATGPRAAGQEAAERVRLTFRRLSGLDRSGPPPPQTLAGQPLHPWTIPNMIGFVRLALIPVFLYLSFTSEDGSSVAAAVVFAVIAVSDYVDGISARLTGQYSRLGALMDPVIDRLLVLAGVVVCWHFELLPRWALAVLAVREVLTLLIARWGLRHGLDLSINWLGRWAVWPVMAAPLLAIAGATDVATALLFVGLVFAIAATAAYVMAGRAQLRARGRGGPPRPRPQGEGGPSSSA